jgi:hypothetical protein
MSTVTRTRAAAGSSARPRGAMRNWDAANAVRPLVCITLVCLASSLPFLSTLPGYFLSDDFGVVQLLAQKPPLHVLSLFTSPWTESIYAVPQDELRPTVALAFQFSSQWGAGSPTPYHLTAIAFHIANTLLVFAIARVAARLNLLVSTFVGLLFAVLPIHAETVAWLQGLSDSVPALFYVSSFLLYAMWRRDASSWQYLASCSLFALALFSKQSAITMTATLVAYDLLVERRTVRRVLSGVSAYLPFVLLTVGYLVLRYILFGQAVREDKIGLSTLAYMMDVQVGALQLLIFGGLLPYSGHVMPELWHYIYTLVRVFSIVGIAAGLILIVSQLRRSTQEEGSNNAGRILYFGPVWWLISTAPLVVTYQAPRHLYIAAVGVVLVLGIALGLLWDSPRRVVRYASAVGGVALILASLLALQRPLSAWNAATEMSRRIVRDVEQEATSAPSGSLLILDIPEASIAAGGWRDRIPLWEYALPFAVRPPFTQTDLTERVRILWPISIDCCRVGGDKAPWYRHMRASIDMWAKEPESPPAIVMQWSVSDGSLVRRSDRDEPSLRSEVQSMLHAESPEALEERLDAALKTGSLTLAGQAAPGRR